MSDRQAFRCSVRHLHYSKDRAYHNSWKRRGELISILANIARKVDRLEYAIGGSRPTPDETIMDTAVDLLVYSLKYQTYLADLDEDSAPDELRGRVAPPYSEGLTGFEVLLDTLDLTTLERADGPTVGVSGTAVISTFNELERCFSNNPAPAPVRDRMALARRMVVAVLDVIAALRRTTPALFHRFLATWRTGYD